MMLSVAKQPPSAQSVDTAALKSFTGLRGVASMVIFIGHFLDYFSGSIEGGPAFTIEYLTSTTVFFLLSGLTLTHIYLPRVDGANFGFQGSKKTFMYKRFARTMPLFWLSALLGLAEFLTSDLDEAYITDSYVVEVIGAFLAVQSMTGIGIGISAILWQVSALLLCYALFPLVGTKLGAKSANFNLAMFVLFYAIPAAVYAAVGTTFDLRLTLHLMVYTRGWHFFMGVALGLYFLKIQPASSPPCIEAHEPNKTSPSSTVEARPVTKASDEEVPGNSDDTAALAEEAAAATSEDVELQATNDGARKTPEANEAADTSSSTEDTTPLAEKGATSGDVELQVTNDDAGNTPPVSEAADTPTSSTDDTRPPTAYNQTCRIADALTAFVFALWLVGVVPTLLRNLSGPERRDLWYRITFDLEFFAAPVHALWLVYILRAPAAYISRAMCVRPLQYLGKISYAIYVLHFPVMTFYGSAVLGEFKSQPRVGWYHVFAIVPIMVGLASFTYYLIENPARKFLLRNIHASKSKS